MTVANKYTVVLHVNWDAGNFEIYHHCTNVEENGALLCFTDAEGVFTKTTAPWTIRKEKPLENKAKVG